MSSHKIEFGLNQLASVASRLYEDLDTPVSLSCYLMLKYKDFDSLVSHDIKPYNYLTAYSFQLDYQAVSFLKKCPDLPTTFSRTDRALEKFMDAELQCRMTNSRLTNLLSGNPTLRGLLYHASEKIRGILGDVPPVSHMPLKFGPGASSTCSGSSVNLLTKLQSKLECSIDAIPLVTEMLRFNHNWLSSHLQTEISGPCSLIHPLTFSVRPYNDLSFVPKNAKIDRAICIEPNSVIPLQLAHGSYIRKRLLFAGLDLNKQADVNRHFAYLGSIDGTYATIDLSSASDTISYELVRLLLPPAWFDRLSALRSEYTRLPDGSFHFNEKFSSMGNGFTFELETLIFYSILLACRTDRKTEVYAFGDDLIVPTADTDLVLSVLDYAGFSINTDKSFSCGPFRESCGSDFFSGYNVRPYFFKGKLGNVSPFEIYPVLNGIRFCASRFAGRDTKYCDSILRRTWSSLLKYVPLCHRHFGPSGYGDNVIVCSRREKAERSGSFLGSLDIRQVIFKPVTYLLGNSDYHIATRMSAISCGHRSRISIRGRGSYKINSLKLPFWEWDQYAWI
ncbi:TPA_asm: RNA-directed RNA polymerase [ssRNA phage SRR6960507_3]|uniref:RNA-directed RNA polymerase n=1 Tax=ssRNA phage SRR6960507_3 TaxID=2786513 RepID=A0A8S5L4B5_9VIRU|nr:RNA-directed RNA polymerase [ssRNA phage SRR6960507_3]DAD52260.1 TPA_asm: RNA-directed RNA polymerase [ssRNA phage SRR6960507_3]